MVQLVSVHYGTAGERAGLTRGAVEATLQEAVAMLRCRRTPRPVPDHMCCKISMELMLDPVSYTPLACSLQPAACSLLLLPPVTQHATSLPPSARPTPSPQVTTPCGISYERACLRDHLTRLRGRGEQGFDPISRKPLQRIEQAVPNLALKEAISEFLAEHPWAYQCTL